MWRSVNSDLKRKIYEVAYDQYSTSHMIESLKEGFALVFHKDATNAMRVEFAQRLYEIPGMEHKRIAFELFAWVSHRTEDPKIFAKFIDLLEKDIKAIGSLDALKMADRTAYSSVQISAEEVSKRIDYLWQQVLKAGEPLLGFDIVKMLKSKASMVEYKYFDKLIRITFGVSKTKTHRLVIEAVKRRIAPTLEKNVDLFDHPAIIGLRNDVPEFDKWLDTLNY